MLRYFLYARKSTDEEDRQILSIEAQLTELREFAKQQSLPIIEEFVESKTAKVPGRPIFNAMIAKLQAGKAEGIIAWHPDRLARNSVDGGQIVYLLDTGDIQSLKFPLFWFDNTSQGKFMLAIAFGQSKYYIDNLRENILRGLRQKIRRGEFPGKPPTGYFNEPRLRTIVIDPKTAPLVRKMFEAYATGLHSVPSLRDLVDSWGLRRFDGKLSISKVYDMLCNPFYIGLMRFHGELCEASHEPLIPKSLFDKVQELRRERSKPRQKTRMLFPFAGLLKCHNCGCSITAEKQKGHHYYRCTRKRGNCKEPFVREEALAASLRGILLKLAIPEDWKEPISNRIRELQEERNQAFIKCRTDLEAELSKNASLLRNLLDLHLAGDITREEYRARKAIALNEKLELQERLTTLGPQGNRALEPVTRFFNLAFQADSVARDENLEKISGFLKSIGSNPRLRAREPFCNLQKPFSILGDFSRFTGWWSWRGLKIVHSFGLRPHSYPKEFNGRGNFLPLRSPEGSLRYHALHAEIARREFDPSRGGLYWTRFEHIFFKIS